MEHWATEAHSTWSSSRCPWSSSLTPVFLQGCSQGSAVVKTAASQCWSASPKCLVWSSCHPCSCGAPLPPSHSEHPVTHPVGKRSDYEACKSHQVQLGDFCVFCVTWSCVFRDTWRRTFRSSLAPLAFSFSILSFISFICIVICFSSFSLDRKKAAMRKEGSWNNQKTVKPWVL